MPVVSGRFGTKGSSACSPAPSAGAETAAAFRVACAAANRYKRETAASAALEAAALASGSAAAAAGQARTEAAIRAAQAAALAAAQARDAEIPDASSEAAEFSASILQRKMQQYKNGAEVEFSHHEKKLLYGRMRISDI